MNHPGTILVLASTFPRWVNDTEPPFVFLLSKALCDLGYDIHVLAPHHPGAKFSETMSGLKVHRFAYFLPFGLERLCYGGGIMSNVRRSLLARFQIPFFLTAEFFAALYLRIRLSPRLIHTHWIIPQGAIASMIARLIPIPIVMTAHGSDIFIFHKGKGRHAITFATKKSAVVTLNSSAAHAALSGIDATSVKKIVPMGVDTSKFSPARRDEALRSELGIRGPFLLAVGRLVELKGFNYLLDAMKKVVANEPEAKLAIIGNGPERQNLEHQASALGISDNVLFLGDIVNSELPKYYATADIFVGPSVKTADGATESFGVVFLEALASGTSVITTGSGGISNIIRDGITGIIVPERDSESIFGAFKKIMQSPSLRSEMRKNGLKLVEEQYSWSKIAQQFALIYENTKS